MSSKKFNNWKQFETIKDRMSNIFGNQLMADIVFRFKSNETLMVHKLILSAGSQVFHQLFNESINEFNLKITFEDNKQCIDLSDCERKHFEPLIHFLYSDQLDIDEDNVSHLIHWANVLKVRIVRDRCIDFITSKLDDNNCLELWRRLTANEKSLDETELIDRCLQMVARNAFNVLRSEDVMDLKIDDLIALLSRNDLNIKEYDLFEIVIHWAKNKCLKSGHNWNDQTLRLTLGLAFDLIRFPAMSAYEFGLIVANYPNLLALNELLALIPYINSGVVIQHQLPYFSMPRIPVCRDITPLPLQHPCICSQVGAHNNNYFMNQCICSQIQPNGYTPFLKLRSPYGQTVLSLSSNLVYPQPSPSSEVKYKNRSNLKLKANLQKKLLVITDPKTGQNLDLEKLAAVDIPSSSPIDNSNNIEDSANGFDGNPEPIDDFELKINVSIDDSSEEDTPEESL